MAARSQERKNFLADVLVTAAEGGIDYWAQILYHRDTIFVRDLEAETERGENTGWQKVTVDTIAHGIGKIKRGEVRIAPSLRKTVIAADRDPAEYGGSIDSEIADCVLQAGLFGEIRYG